MDVPRAARASVWAALLVAAPLRAGANPASEALRARASAHLYNLNHVEAMADFRQAVAAHPRDGAAYRGLAKSLWLSITVPPGNMTGDDQLRRRAKPDKCTTPVPQQDTAAYPE